MAKLSRRSERATAKIPEYKAVFVAQFQPDAPGFYCSESNPGGYIPLSIAENRLSVQLVSQRYSSVPPAPTDYFQYGDPRCDILFSGALARFLSTYVTKASVAVGPESLVATSGASGALDQLMHHLCDAGDGVLVVAPGYQGFEFCAGMRAGVRVVAAQLREADGFRTTVGTFDSAWREAGGAQSGIRAVVLSTPGNPSGEVLGAGTLRDIIGWARERRLHVISDELYALSVFDAGAAFTSAYEVTQGKLGDDVHLVWALSKDFCASGLRTGAVVTHNKALLARLTNTTFLADVPRTVQWALADMLADDDFVVKYLAENRRRLASAYGRITALLDSHSVPYVQAQAGFFLILDLRKFLDEHTREGEMRLFRRLSDARVLLTPCCEAFSTTYGLFRMCYGAVSENTLDEAWSRIRSVLFPQD